MMCFAFYHMILQKQDKEIKEKEVEKSNVFNDNIQLVAVVGFFEK